MSAPETHNQFELFPAPSNRGRVRYARAFAHINLFGGTTHEAKSGILWKRDFPFEGGVVVQIGPSLVVRDEDILIAVIQLCNLYRMEDESETQGVLELVERQNAQSRDRLSRLLKYEGEVADHGEPGGKLHLDDDSIASVLRLNVSVSGSISFYKLADYLGIAWSARSKVQIKESLVRLSETMIALHSDQRKQSPTPLLKVEFNKVDSRFTAEYGPELKHLLSDYILLDLELRSQLNNMGKGLHKCLVANGFPDTDQPVEFTKQDLVRGLPSFRSFSRDIKQLTDGKKGEMSPLELMRRNKFISDWGVSGEGVNRDPFIFTVHPILPTSEE